MKHVSGNKFIEVYVPKITRLEKGLMKLLHK